MQVWKAHWIAASHSSPNAYGVYHFRRTFDLTSRPQRFVVHVSADNRYELFVNGTRVAAGPARGDLYHWRYDTLDLAPHLKAGRNVIAAVVWNWGEYAPLAQISAQTGFLMQGESANEQMINTGKSWHAIADDAYSVLPVTSADVGRVYYVAAPGERVEGKRYPWRWADTDFDDFTWPAARAGDVGCSLGWVKDDVPGDCHDPRMLVPRSIPLFSEQPVRFARIRRTDAIEVPSAFLQGHAAISIPAHTHARVLLDMDNEVTAYPELKVSGGAGASVTLRYAESLWIPGTQEKGNRDEVNGKEVRGIRDVFVADGGDHRLFRPLWWRAFRYVEIMIDTQDQALAVDDIAAAFIAYPFERRAQFTSDAPQWLNKVLEVGWWTNRLSSQDTYLDAYYEQMQYVGDTRIEALVSLYESGDARLMRNAIEQIDSTRMSDGLTFSRAPSRLYQYTPTFSLLWIGMLHDYWWYVDDPAFARQRLPGMRAVLSWFARLQTDDGTLRSLPYYNFLDSDVKWNAHALAPYEMQLLRAYQWAAELESRLGDATLAQRDRAAAGQLTATLRARYWDQPKGFFSDDAAHTLFSQQTNALAILTGLVRPSEVRAVMERTLADKSLTQCTIYFRYYLNRALVKAGLGDRYLDMLSLWRELLQQGVTAWPESEAPNARSDCHGWGDHPNIEIYRTVLGVDSAAPGFAQLHIEPHLGDLHQAKGMIPHPRGPLAVSLRRTRNNHLDINLQSPVNGDFIWNGQKRAFPAGKSHFAM